MRRNPLVNMSTRGGIITTDFLENIRMEDPKNASIQFTAFNRPARYLTKKDFDDKLCQIWNDLSERWDAISTQYKNMNISEARTKWIIPFMKALAFEPVFNKQKIIIDNSRELTFTLSHYGWNDYMAPIIHTVPPNQGLEDREAIHNGKNRSPHDELQVFLNVTKGCKWSIVTNGILLRILREFHHTTTKGYVEFDIENIFRENNFSDFRLLYRMCHSSRFAPNDRAQCPLERFYRESMATGVTIGENLKKNVKTAIEVLGNGFLTEQLTEEMICDELRCKEYYSDILTVIYRMLFLLFAERRAMLPTRDSLYADGYSMIKLREIAEEFEPNSDDEHVDLWEGLKVTFKIVGQGSTELKVFGYNGTLFDDDQIPLLRSLFCKNTDLLSAIKHLSLIEEEHVQKRINYLELGVEEIDSIYENLLQFTPRVLAKQIIVEDIAIPPRKFFLDPRGIGRKTTGSYYTDPRLIDALVNSALKPVLEDRLGRKISNKEKELLALKVCDPACGSGAFLIAATNFLAKELAQIRTGQVEPSDMEIRRARRIVLQHCIYGVDLNPMAVELTKVSLWINAAVENMPLNFLDHHIKCGNSLIGATPDLIKKGIPNSAFTASHDDDKQTLKKIKKLNRSNQGNTRFDEYTTTELISNVSADYEKLTEFREREVRDIETKKRRYSELIESLQYRNQKLAADAWTAAFFWKLTEDSPFPPISNSVEAIIRGNRHIIDSNTMREIERIAKVYQFFHWYIEFPDVYNREATGFDCILGNPPWERIKVQD